MTDNKRLLFELLQKIANDSGLKKIEDDTKFQIIYLENDVFDDPQALKESMNEIRKTYPYAIFVSLDKHEEVEEILKWIMNQTQTLSRPPSPSA